MERRGFAASREFLPKVVATGRERLRGPIKDEHDQPVLDSAGNRMEGLLPDVYSGRKGRIDVLVVVEADGETIMVIIELKSTDWTRMRPENVRRNVARHAAQLYSYQGHLTRGMWGHEGPGVGVVRGGGRGSDVPG